MNVICYMEKEKNSRAYKRSKVVIGVCGVLITFIAFFWPSAGWAGNSVGVRVDIDRGILPAGSPQKAIIKVTLDPPPAPKKGNLSARELQLLKLFYTRPNEVLSRDRLLNLAWGIEYYGITRTLRLIT